MNSTKASRMVNLNFDIVNCLLNGYIRNPFRRFRYEVAQTSPVARRKFPGGEMNTSRKSDKSDTKKHYESPKLVIYGDIWALTQNRGSSGKADHGGFPASKTA